MTHQTQTVEDADCCIVGAGPAGAILALILARQGVQTTLLEAMHDFEPRNLRPKLTPARARYIISRDDDEVHVGDVVGEAAFRGAAEEDQADEWTLPAGVRLRQRIDVRLDANWQLNVRSL